MKTIKSYNSFTFILLFSLFLSQLALAQNDFDKPLANGIKKDLLGEEHSKYLTEFNWKFDDNGTGLTLVRNEGYYSDSEGQIIWNLENFHQVYDYVFNTMKNYRGGKTKNIYVDSAILQLEVMGTIPEGQEYFVYLYNYDAKGTSQIVQIKNNSNYIVLNKIKKSSRVGIIVKSDEPMQSDLKIKVVKLMAFGKAGATHGHLSSDKLKESNIKDYIKGVDRPTLTWTEHCGVPSFLWNSPNWNDFNQSTYFLNYLCEVKNNVSILNDLFHLVPPGEEPKEPQKPQELEDLYNNQGDQNKEVLQAPIGPIPPVAPIKQELNSFNIEDFVLNSYHQHSYMDLKNDGKKNKAYLIDLSGSVQGEVLETIIAELKILSQILEDDQEISLYLMYNHPGIIPAEGFPALLENYSRISSPSKKKRKGRPLASNLEEAISLIKYDKDKTEGWDQISIAITSAILNERVEEINILSDTYFTDRFTNRITGRNDSFLLVESLLDNRSNPLKINVFNFGSAPATEFSKKLVEIENFEGQLFTNRSIVPKKAQTTLERIKIIKSGNEVGINQVIQEAQKEANFQYERELEQYEAKFKNWQKEVEKYNKLSAENDESLLNQNSNKKIDIEEIKNEKLYSKIKANHDNWVQEHQKWQQQQKYYDDIVNQVTTPELRDVGKVVQKLKDLMKRIDPENEGTKEAKYIESLIEQITSSDQ